MNLKIVIIWQVFIILTFLTITSCEKEVSTSPPEPEPPQGFIFVDSNPQNYKIYLDGRFTGRFTPDTLPYVEEQEHQIDLKRKYWLDSSATSIAEYGVTKTVYIDFMQSSKVYGSLKLQSNPDSALVEINDSLTSIRTPYILQGILPGIYNIKYHLKEHRSISARTVIESNKITTVNLVLQDTSIWVDFTKKNSILLNNNITTIAVDQDNRVWVGTVTGGMVTIRGKEWNLINTSNSNLPSDSINVIEIDKNNTKWVGTAKGLVEFRKGIVQRVYNHSNSALKANDNIYAIDFYNDILFVGTADGLLKIDNNETVLYEVTNSSGESLVTAIEIDEQNDELWVGLKGRLIAYNLVDDKPTLNPKVGNVGDVVFNLELSQTKIRPSNGEIWALFSSLSDLNEAPDPDDKEIIHVSPYLTIWNGSKWYFRRLGNEDLFLTDIIIDKDDFVWITSSQGLRKHKDLDDNIIIRAYNSGLFSDELSTLDEDENGTLWLGSIHGLYKYKKNLEPN